MDDDTMEHISDADGKFVINTCNKGKHVTIKADGFCETPFELPIKQEEISVDLKKSGRMCSSIEFSKT